MANIPMPDEKDKPSYVCAAYKEMAPALEIVRDIDGGWLTMRNKGRTYLRQYPREGGEDYAIRLNRPVFFNGFSRTHIGLTGMVFRIEPLLGEDVPNPIVDLWENIDNQGTHGNVFLKEAFDDVLVAGHGFILIDHPTIDDPTPKSPDNPEGRTKRDDLDEGARPYWVYVKKENVRNWQTVVENGQIKLDLVVIWETVEEKDGAFGSKETQQYRVLRRNGGAPTFELWQKIEGRDVITQAAQPITNVTEIPLVPIYTNRTGFLRSYPPLFDLAQLVWDHYELSSDMRNNVHTANVPLLLCKGIPASSIEIGPHSALCIPDKDAAIDVKWLETAGHAIGQTRDILQDTKADMAVVGLNMLVRETRAAETAEAKRLDKSEQDSALASAARSLQDATEEALRFTAQFMRVPEGGSIAVNQDFMLDPMTPQLMAEYRNLVAGNQLSLETMWAILEENGALPDDFDPDVEKEQIEAGSMAFMPPQLVEKEEEDEEKDGDEE
jgi:hypothetical protein